MDLEFNRNVLNWNWRDCLVTGERNAWGDISELSVPPQLLLGSSDQKSPLLVTHSVTGERSFGQ